MKKSSKQASLSDFHKQSTPPNLDKLSNDDLQQIFFQMDLFDQVFDAIPDIIGIQDREHRVIKYNKAGYNFLGLKPEEVEGKKCYELIGKKFACDLCASKEVFKTKKNARLVRYYPEIDKWLDVRSYPILDEEGNIVRMVEHLRDVTAEKLLENKIRKAKTKAEESDRLKSAFLSNISHEIRTPLNAIIGFSDLILSQQESGQSPKEYLEYIRNSGLELMDTLDDILDFSLIESGQLELDYEPFSIVQLLNDLKARAIEEIDHRGKDLQLDFQMEKDSQEIVFCDRKRVTKILWNLVQNAIKYTESGFVKVKTDVREGIEMIVSDSGIGISEEEYDRIFKGFYRAESSNSFRGAGLGLSLAKRLVNQMGGDIDFKSELGIGSTFLVRIPCNIETQGKIGVKTTEKILPYNWTGKKILIAEDEELNFLFLRETIAITNAEVFWARNGMEAVELFKKNDEIDLVLMDIKMPLLDGYDAASSISEMRSDVPIVAQTAYARELMDKKGNGFSYMITKPIRPKQLLLILNKYLSS